MKMKKSFIILLVLILTLVVSGCGSTAPTATDKAPDAGKQPDAGKKEEVIKIGVIVAITGPASVLGKPMAEGAELVKKQLQAMGGKIGGKNVEIIIKDYESNDTTGLLHMKQLVSEENIIAVVGTTQTSTTMAISDIAQEKQIPLMSISPLTKQGDYIFNLNQGDELSLQRITDYLIKKNIKSVAWINSRDGFGQGGLPVFKKLAEKNGINIVATEDFDASATDMTVPLTKIKAKNPEAIISWSRSPGAGIVAKNYKQLGFKVPMIQSHAASNQGFLKQVGKDGEGVLAVGTKVSVFGSLTPSDQEIYKNYISDYKAQFGYSPDNNSTLPYDGLKILLKAIEAGKTTGKEINDWLVSGGLGEYVGLNGKFNYIKSDKRNGPDASALVILEAYNDGSNMAWRLLD